MTEQKGEGKERENRKKEERGNILLTLMGAWMVTAGAALVAGTIMVPGEVSADSGRVCKLVDCFQFLAGHSILLRWRQGGAPPRVGRRRGAPPRVAR